MEVLPRLTPGYGLVFFDGYAPDSSMLNLIMDNLLPGGMLVCANLGLVSVSERQHLLAMLDDLARFTQYPPIENGGTVVRRRLE